MARCCCAPSSCFYVAARPIGERVDAACWCKHLGCSYSSMLAWRNIGVDNGCGISATLSAKDTNSAAQKRPIDHTYTSYSFAMRLALWHAQRRALGQVAQECVAAWHAWSRAISRALSKSSLVSFASAACFRCQLSLPACAAVASWSVLSAHWRARSPQRQVWGHKLGECLGSHCSNPPASNVTQ